MDSAVKTFDFQTDQDQFIQINKTDLIQAFYREFGIKMSSDDIKILDDGLKLLLQFGTQNDVVPKLTFKKMADYCTSSVVNDVTFDDESLKLWIHPADPYIFVDSNDERLSIVKSGSDAPKNTVQVDIGEGKVYTLLYAQDVKISDAINECLSLVGTLISTRPMSKDRQVDDQRVAIIRKKFGQSGKMYNDRVVFKHPKIAKVIVHV